MLQVRGANDELFLVMSKAAHDSLTQSQLESAFLEGQIHCWFLIFARSILKTLLQSDKYDSCFLNNVLLS